MLQEIQQKIVVGDYEFYAEYLRQIEAENKLLFSQAKTKQAKRISEDVAAWVEKSKVSKSMKRAAEAQVIVEEIASIHMM